LINFDLKGGYSLSVQLDNLTVAYGKKIAVDEFSVSFAEGATGLLGINGAGKSSLIKGLLGLVPLKSGSATIMGKDIRLDSIRVRQLVGYMPEDDCMIPGLTGVELVRYAGELVGMPGSDAMQRAHDVLFAVGLGEARYRNVESYSSGMKQRVKLAQAIVHHPRLLFLDEPTSGMDPKGRQEILELIQYISQRCDISIVLATHILADVERTCDHVVMIHEGRAVTQERVDNLRGQYTHTLTVRIEGDQQKFKKALIEQGCTILEEDRQLIDVKLPENGDMDLILNTVVKTGVVLRKMVPSIQTLEEVFVKRIGGEHADI
jgi:ABC-2 type transport system ATP-binding protein